MLMRYLWRVVFWLRRPRGGQYITVRAEHLTRIDWANDPPS